jgi:hypothetical protein
VVDRYEALRANARQGLTPPSYGHALLVHQGMPGWMSYVADRAREPQPAGRPTSAEKTAGLAAFPVPDPTAGRTGVVPVLASVVSRCIGVTS